MADALGMRPLLAHCHLGLGQLYRRKGMGERAREHLAAATAMFREMDMRFWLEKAEAELKELGGRTTSSSFSTASWRFGYATARWFSALESCLWCAVAPSARPTRSGRRASS